MNSDFFRQKVEISLEGVGMVFGKKGRQITALQNITFDVEQHEFVTLLGPSGCGKSTLLRLMADLLQPSSGQITVRKEHPKEVRLRRKFGIIFRTPNLFEWRTVRENIELPLEVLEQTRQMYREQVDQLLDTVGLAKFKDYYPWQLSLGMQIRVAMARALSLDPPILFMDEPFSTLDEFTKDKLQLDVLEMKKKMNKTIIFVTRSLTEAVFLSDRIIVLSANPGCVHAIHQVPLGSNRTLQTRESPLFQELTTVIQKSINEGNEPSND
ncbi:ABC transporter ATP-binding protein [Paenibacillus qinlingensis]|uniref:NitT/TauT family transport system ATP-binding protein n=1 Tax=Paenibacillus qinlingensis TaxID=1837343 RepID=A0ABU1NYX8_9BACL|nr:ABC transporter ATP-binding protein [Paenibacillus qinlingensis]MDR6552702.1 NitT/TauT family transport system ATP-binding protein [Paenibacillus qinlingensis]